MEMVWVEEYDWLGKFIAAYETTREEAFAKANSAENLEFGMWRLTYKREDGYSIATALAND